MLDDIFKLVRMKHSPVTDPEMVERYASLGYFHYNYIKGLDSMNSCENLVKDNGVIRSKGENSLQDGSYIEVSVVDFSRKKKISSLFIYQQHRMRINVGNLIDLCELLHSSLKIESSNCFVKFDVYAVV